jgi:CubicO group peptidase (beta-lactamase class C family)
MPGHTKNRTLLTHSSGIAYDFAHPGLIKWSASRGRTIDFHSYTLEGYTYPLVFEPGEGFVYGAGIDWAGVTIERLTKSTLEEYMQHNIFQPLEMTSSTFEIVRHPEFASRRAAVGVRPSPDVPPIASSDNGPESPEQLGGGGGLFTTANDYAKLLGALISGDDRILNAKSREELFRPQLRNPMHLQEWCDGPLHDWLFPQFPRGLLVNYGLGGLVNLQDVPKMRRKGSMMWSGATSPHWVCLD